MAQQYIVGRCPHCPPKVKPATSIPTTNGFAIGAVSS